MTDKEISEFKVELCKGSIMRLNANGFQWEKDEQDYFNAPLLEEDIDEIINDEDELCHIHQLLEDLEEKYC